jgi:hypothetical protein
MRSEKRKHDRFIPKENAFAALGPKFIEVGKIKDICLGGLAFEYIAIEAYNEAISEIDIFLVGVEFHLYKMPCMVIYNIDIAAPYLNNKFHTLFIAKRCGVKFEKLSNDLKALLRYFLKFYTTGKVH